MATYEEAITALRNADAAGDTEAAQQLAQIANRLKPETTPGGAAVGNPNLLNQSQPRQPVEFGAIAGAGGFGAAAGALGSEILTGAAGVARQIPQGARIAPLLESAAIATKAAGRPAGAVLGGISGLSSETAGQAAEQMGAGPVTAEAVRFAAGGLTPEGIQLGKFVLEKVLQAPALSIEHKVKKELAKLALDKLGRDPDSLTDQERKFLDEQVSALRGGEKTDQPLEGVYGSLKGAADTKLAVADTEAHKIISQAAKDAEAEFTKAMKGPVTYARTAQERIKQRGETALSTAQLQRLNIGNDAELSDVGAALRNSIVKRNEEALAKRQAEFKANEEARDAVVQGKEAAGEFVENLPEYKNLVNELRNQLLVGKKAQEQKTAPVTEGGVLRAYQNIYDAVTRRRVQTGVGPDGNPTYKEFPTSFQALDDVRRRLGQVFKGQPPEGYEAISGGMARKYYAQISEIQKKFAGEPQERLLKQYADATEGLEMFGSKAGKRMTAVDRYDDSQFQTDARMLPRQFFASKKGVNDLIELTGDRAQVIQAARDFTTNELRDKTAPQVRAWMTSHRELMAALPEVQREVGKYMMTLERGEAINRSAGKAVDRLGRYESDTLKAAERKGSELTTTAERAATGIRSGAEREAGVLMGSKFPAERVRVLIESGDRKQWELAAPAIMASPNGKQQIGDSVRQVMADKASRSTKGLSEFFARNVRPAIESTGLMTSQQADEIASRLTAIENMKIPEEQKLGFARRVILQSFAGYGSSVSARVGSSLVDLVPQ